MNHLADGTGKGDLYRTMNKITPTTRPVPAGWLEAIAESEAELAKGLIVPGDEVMRELYESIARLEGRQADGKNCRRITSR